MRRALLFLIASLSLAAPRFDFLFDKAPFASCHASTIVETSPGEFLVSWFGGTAEGRSDVAIWGARFRAGVWTGPFELAREHEIACYNPVLFSAGGILWLYYKFGPSPSTWTAARLSSRDAGNTWSTPEHLPAGLYGPIKNKPLVLPGGTIVSGTSVESYGSWACWVERSTDWGRTWTRIGPITAAPGGSTSAGQLPPVPDAVSWRQTSGVIQPAIVPLGGKRLRMFMRSTRAIGRICYADSHDSGRTWSQARPTPLPNPNSGIDAAGLRDGRIVLVYNHSADARTPLNAAVSRDGDQWSPVAILEDGPGEYSYPALIQAVNGDVNITYTWNRRKIRRAVIPLEEIP